MFNTSVALSEIAINY